MPTSVKLFNLKFNVPTLREYIGSVEHGDLIIENWLDDRDDMADKRIGTISFENWLKVIKPELLVAYNEYCTELCKEQFNNAHN